MKNIQCSSKRDRFAYSYLLENHTSINAKSTMAQQLCRWLGIIINSSIGQTRSKRWPRMEEISLPNREAHQICCNEFAPNSDSPQQKILPNVVGIWPRTQWQMLWIRRWLVIFSIQSNHMCGLALFDCILISIKCRILQI